MKTPHMKSLNLAPVFVLGALLVPAGSAAHPHIFVDTGFAFEFDDTDQLVGIKVTWQYDEFYSLLITEDLQLDPDGDGVLTPEEGEQLTGFDTNWEDGFNGDLELRIDGVIVPLSGPQGARTELREGQIVSRHTRQLLQPIEKQDGPFSLKAFDPSYYTAYEINLPVTLTPHLQGHCLLERIDPDIAGGLAQMQAQLLRLDANADLEENDIPLIGGDFATEVLLSCPSS